MFDNRAYGSRRDDKTSPDDHANRNASERVIPFGRSTTEKLDRPEVNNLRSIRVYGPELNQFAFRLNRGSSRE